MFEFNEFGNLNGGIIKGINLDTIEKEFVINFPDSKTRKRNFDGFIEFLDYFESTGVLALISRMWLDGSFLTTKPNPNDIDLVVLFNPAKGNILKINDFFNKAAKPVRIIGLNFHCDSYYSIDHELIPNTQIDDRNQFEYQNKYWLGQLGFDRNGKNKGIIEINFNEEG